MQLSYTFLLLGALSLSSVSATTFKVVKERTPEAKDLTPLLHGFAKSLNPLNARQLICGSGHTCTEACENCGSGYVWCGTESLGSCDCADTSAGDSCTGGLEPAPTADPTADLTTPIGGAQTSDFVDTFTSDFLDTFTSDFSDPFTSDLPSISVPSFTASNTFFLSDPPLTTTTPFSTPTGSSVTVSRVPAPNAAMPTGGANLMAMAAGAAGLLIAL